MKNFILSNGKMSASRTVNASVLIEFGVQLRGERKQTG